MPLKLYERDHQEIQYKQELSEVYQSLRDVSHKEVWVYVNEVQQRLHSNGTIDDQSSLLRETCSQLLKKKNKKMNKDCYSHSMIHFNSSL